VSYRGRGPARVTAEFEPDPFRCSSPGREQNAGETIGGKAPRRNVRAEVKCVLLATARPPRRQVPAPKRAVILEG